MNEGASSRDSSKGLLCQGNDRLDSRPLLDVGDEALFDNFSTGLTIAVVLIVARKLPIVLKDCHCDAPSLLYHCGCLEG